LPVNPVSRCDACKLDPRKSTGMLTLRQEEGMMKKPGRPGDRKEIAGWRLLIGDCSARKRNQPRSKIFCQ